MTLVGQKSPCTQQEVAVMGFKLPFSALLKWVVGHRQAEEYSGGRFSQPFVNKEDLQA